MAVLRQGAVKGRAARPNGANVPLPKPPWKRAGHPGSGARTIFDKAPIVLIEFSAAHYRLEVWQSFATHAWDLLAAASREIVLDL